MTRERVMVFRLTNDYRLQNGRRSLRRSTLLDRSAKSKAKYLARTGVLAHGRWWTLIWKVAGRTFDSIGENIASGQRDATTVVNAWIDSPPHEANMLAGKFSHLGVGHTRRGGRDYWVQHYGGK